MGWLDDVEDAVEGALDTLSDVVNTIEEYVQTGAQIAGDVADLPGAGLAYIINGVTYALDDLIGIHMRGLLNDERNTLRKVFSNSVPLDKIVVTSIPVKKNRPFTIPGNMITELAVIIPILGPAIVLRGLILHLEDKFLINVGSMYRDQSLVTTPTAYDISHFEMAGSMLVHETTHVWQGVNGAFSWLYVFSSIFSRIGSSDAYHVDEAHLQTWADYGVEQQAVLVEHWYSRGSLPGDSNYPFIRDNVRPAKPWEQTLFKVLKGPLLAGPGGVPPGALVGQRTTAGPLATSRAASVNRPGGGGVR
jgi:hypothetical protein